MDVVSQESECVRPEDVHPDFSLEVLQAIRRAREKSRNDPGRPFKQVFADLGIHTAESARKTVTVKRQASAQRQYGYPPGRARSNVERSRT